VAAVAMVPEVTEQVEMARAAAIPVVEMGRVVAGLAAVAVAELAGAIVRFLVQ